MILNVQMYCYVFADHALLLFSDLQMVTETLLVILVTFHQSPNNFLSKARLGFWLLAGKTSAPGAGAAEGLVLPGLPSDGNCPRAPLVRT